MSYQHLQPPRLFRSKADTLGFLLQHSELCIPEFFAFTLYEWQRDPDSILHRAALFAPSPVAVRSSCLREDLAEYSGAGAFTSILHITPDHPNALADAVYKVFTSYGDASADDQVIIQRMVPDVAVSGVIMTRVPTDGAPYYTVNYDDESGRTDTVTGGTGVHKTVYIVKNTRDSDFDSKRLLQYVAFARRLEEICENDALDLEFCQDGQGVIHLLQVRPLCTKTHWIAAVDSHIHGNIDFVKDFVSQRMAPSAKLYGSHTILGVMPDWNPAEMIGITPRPLAASLYRELITQKAWREARTQMGYRDMPPVDLMVLIGGRPFIDVRASFNSFLPQGLDASIGETLVEAWLTRLDQNPHLHDKVEFEIAQTVRDFCFNSHLDERYPGLLSAAERESFDESLRRFTLRCLDTGPSSTLAGAFSAMTELKRRQAGFPLPRAGQLPTTHDAILPFIEMLLDECYKYGTLPFSVIARHAFIAESLLKTAVKRDALKPERLAAFKNSIRTVAGEMSAAMRAVCRDAMAPRDFMEQYGHLRPGSYDILSPRYADREGLWGNTPDAADLDAPSFSFTSSERRDITSLLAEAGLGSVSVDQLENYARLAVAGREKVKFVFSRHLSDILEYLGTWGAELGLSKDAISYMNVQDVLAGNRQTILRDKKEFYRHVAAQGQSLFELTRSLKLGYIIRSVRDVSVVPQHRSAPNFVSHADIEKDVTVLSADSPCTIDLTDRIICIENADPGFDWIFTRNIAGLVTMFGGVNSHMAIRCAEYGLPAAIGVGEQLFTQISAAARCRLNAGACVLQPLR